MSQQHIKVEALESTLRLLDSGYLEAIEEIERERNEEIEHTNRKSAECRRQIERDYLKRRDEIKEEIIKRKAQQMANRNIGRVMKSENSNTAQSINNSSNGNSSLTRPISIKEENENKKRSREEFCDIKREDDSQSSDCEILTGPPKKKQKENKAEQKTKASQESKSNPCIPPKTFARKRQQTRHERPRIYGKDKKSQCDEESFQTDSDSNSDANDSKKRLLKRKLRRIDSDSDSNSEYSPHKNHKKKHSNSSSSNSKRKSLIKQSIETKKRSSKRKLRSVRRQNGRNSNRKLRNQSASNSDSDYVPIQNQDQKHSSAQKSTKPKRTKLKTKSKRRKSESSITAMPELTQYYKNKQNQATNAKKRFKQLPKNDQGQTIIHLPIDTICTEYKSGHVFVTDFGKIPKNPTKADAYCDKSYVYPIGFKAYRIHLSTEDPRKKVKYFMEICDNGMDGPLYKVYAENDDAGKHKTYKSPTTPWQNIIDAVSRKAKELNCKEGNRNSNGTSGIRYFGMRDYLVMGIIELLPNAKKCKTYWKEKNKYNIPPKPFFVNVTKHDICIQ